MVKVICIGKKHDPLSEPLISHYQSRLKPYESIDWIILPPSEIPDESKVVDDESRRLLEKIQPSDYLVVLDHTGQAISSRDLAKYLDEARSWSKQIVFIIGGAYGLNTEVLERADLVFAIGKVTFPHQLTRVILTEQLYRAFSIINSGNYHHE